MKSKTLLFLSLLIFLAMTNCKQPSDEKDVIKEWIGKSLIIPKDIDRQSLFNTKNKYDFEKESNKIIEYIDSTGCTECKLSLQKWKFRIREISKLNKNVLFYFIINAKNYDVIKSIFQKERFECPYFFDYENSFFKTNKLSKNSDYHIFLIDHNNRILLIGYPIANIKTWQLYNESILALI